ncbi:hypothetical protein [Clostridium sp. D53t1_180928_C8]|uniref:hypothetical protein n=1 Tax=Clostridium sp. D53t1_180928_C8 TaxID=2787101 RepID=UPI0018AA9176|nr:hypothetical protein [Clostridium sp. D53t1_180928_C8]
MKRWFKRNFYFNELNSMLFITITFYLVSAGAIYFAYKNGALITTSIYDISFEIENVVLAPTVPFIILYSFLQVAIPPFFSVWLFFEYQKKFSNVEKINRILPISNRNKIINITISIVLFYIIFLIITYITNLNIGIKEYNSFYKIALSVSIVFCAIITDILCRERNVGEKGSLVFIVISVIIFFNLWKGFFGVLEEYLVYIIVVASIVLVVFSILEFVYILKKIDNIKIN